MRSDLPISASSVQLTVQIAAERGLDAAGCLRGSGISEDLLLDPLAEVTIGREFAVMRNLVRHVGDEPGFGIECGRRYHVAMHGTWGLLMATARDLRESVTIAFDYLELGWAFTSITFRFSDDDATVIIADDEIPADLRTYLVERIAAAIKVMLSELIGVETDLTKASFRHAEPPDVSRHIEVLGVLPRFGAGENSLSFDAALLDRRLPQGNEWVRQGYERLCRDIVAARRARTGTAGTVRELLVREPGQIPDLDEVAKSLGMSSRTLLRRLSDEGTSYRKLVDEVRQAIAEELLGRTHLTNEQISNRLGYSESANFARAFKRWQGSTPQDYRLAQAVRG